MEKVRTKQTQCQRIIQYIKDFGSITHRDEFIDLAILNFGARMSNLRKQGYKFNVTVEKNKNRYGEICTYNRYTLRSDNNEQQ